MTLTEIISERFSCRSYSDYAPTEAELTALLEAARLAPSATNKQPWHFTVVRAGNDAAKNAIVASYNRPWINTANTFIIVSGNAAGAWVRPCDNHCHVDVDIAIATEHICLRATDIGLATCWICNFDPDILADGITFPEGYKPMVILPVGKPADGVEVPVKTRKTLAEITTWL